MKTTQTLPSLMLLLAVALLSAAHTAEAAARGVRREPKENTRTRMLMGKDDAGKNNVGKNDDGKNGGTTTGGGATAGGNTNVVTTTNTFKEASACLPFYDRNEPWKRSSYYDNAIDNPSGLHTATCNTNTCGGVGNVGCCRVYTNALACDSAETGYLLSTSNSLPCICNEFTDNSHLPLNEPAIFGVPDPTGGLVTEIDDPNADLTVNGLPAPLQCMVYDEASEFYDRDYFGFPFAGLPQFKSCTSNAFCQNQGLGCCAAGVCYCSADRECLPEA